MDKAEMLQQRSQLVVKSNELIQKARYHLNINQQKFLAYIISEIKPTDRGFKEFTIKIEDFCQITGIDKEHFYTDFMKMIDDFDSKVFWIDTPTERYKFYWFADATYVKGKGTVRITLSKRLNQYLLGLSQNFTQYELYNILALNSKYSIRLFELFKSYSYQRVKEFEINYLKELLDSTNYVNYKDFRVRVLEPATKEINLYTELNIEYQEVRQGKKVVKIIFIINKKDAVETYVGYRKAIERLDEKNKQIKGQMSIYDFLDYNRDK